MFKKYSGNKRIRIWEKSLITLKNEIIREQNSSKKVLGQQSTTKLNSVVAGGWVILTLQLRLLPSHIGSSSSQFIFSPCIRSYATWSGVAVPERGWIPNFENILTAFCWQNILNSKQHKRISMSPVFCKNVPKAVGTAQPMYLMYRILVRTSARCPGTQLFP